MIFNVVEGSFRLLEAKNVKNHVQFMQKVAVHKLECTQHNFITWTTSISSKNHVQLMHSWHAVQSACEIVIGTFPVRVCCCRVTSKSICPFYNQQCFYLQREKITILSNPTQNKTSV